MRRWLAVTGLLIAWALLLGAASCGSIKPPKPPEPPPACPATCPPGTACTTPALGCVAIPPPGPVCEAGQHHSCWHRPPTSPVWLYACPVYNAAGGITGTVDVTDPTTCPAAPVEPPPVEPPPVEPPPAAGCSIDGEPGPELPAHRPALGGEVNAAMTALRPDCAPGSRCVLQEGRQEWQARVVAELRRRGLCAGQHAPGTDEVAAATSATAPREGWHVYAGPAGGPGTAVWSPGAARPAYAAPGTPPPVEPPPVEPPPPSGTCPSAMVAAIEDPAARQMVVKPTACKRCYGATPRVCDHPAAAVIAGRPGQRCVPLGPDGSDIRLACETLFLGGPTPLWQAGAVTIDLSPDPPLAWEVRANGSGTLRACDRLGVTCSPWLTQ